MINEPMVNTARLEFATSMLTHHVLVPLFIGAMLIAAVLETLYLTNNNPTYKSATKFIVKLCVPILVVVIILGIFTPPLAEDWSNYIAFAGNVDGGLSGKVAIVGALVLLVSYVIFFAGWNRAPRWLHLVATWTIPFTCAYSEAPAIALNGWMHDPMASSKYNIETFNFSLTTVYDYFLAPMTGLRFLHTFSASFLIGAAALISLSCYYLIKGKHIEFSKKTILASSIVGLVFSLTVAVSGDYQGRAVHQAQPMKLAHLEAIWETEPGPADFILFAIPDQETMKNSFELKIPNVLGWLLNGFNDTPVQGIKNIRQHNVDRIRNGLIAYEAQQQLKATKPNIDQTVVTTFKAHQNDLGYALLLEKYTDDILLANEQQISAAADDTMINVPALFYSFRLMLFSGFFLLVFFSFWIFKVYKDTIQETKKSTLIISIFALPIAYFGYFSGWILSEYGRQPWIINEVLPTVSAVSNFPDGVTSGFQLSTMIISFPILFVLLGFIVVFYLKQGPEHHFTAKK